MADAPSQLPVALTFAGLAGAGPEGSAPTVMPADAGETLRAFFEAHPTVEFAQFELALNEAGDDLEFAAGTLHGEDGAPLREGREAHRAGEAFRRLLRHDPHLAALPVRLVVAMEGIEHTFRIMRDATGAARPAGQSTDADARAAARERRRLEAHDARWDQRDVLPPDDDHAA
ncbi:hypothetical protein [Roseisolibacter agri]|uniref:Uncharacterized protein n=1 Tax=Roseisolibacter agri TaxID=2014610 RepID=A0AA37QHE6_9BACT|nr:hypothetical protein [Roseisolibacter agri]GLC26883.1 hypothetical protein rosag_33960 [Roseisolibacter agri]